MVHIETIMSRNNFNPLAQSQQSIGLSLMKAGGSGTTCHSVYEKVFEIEAFMS